jgi:hypothetical protein
MGIYFTDQFSLLHFASGIVAYYWNISFIHWFLLHAIYEILQNSAAGISFINNKLKVWPGGKLGPDSLLNIIGDQFYGMAGWLFAHIMIHVFYRGKLYDEFAK